MDSIFFLFIYNYNDENKRMVVVKILLYGVSHKTTPIEIRENYTIEEQKVPEQLAVIKSFSGVEEAVILSTCNRTEYYLYIDQDEFKHGDMLHYLSKHTGYEISEVISTSYGKSNQDAVDHLFKVATGLDSLIIGETQILSQVKQAFALAIEQKTSGPILNSLFNKAISFSKKMHTKTNLDQLSYNPGTAAVKLCKEEWETITDKRFLLIGTGKMIRLTAKTLFYQGVTHITLTGRNEQKVNDLAHELNLWAQNAKKADQLTRYFFTADFNHLPMSLAVADGIIAATKAQHYLVTERIIEEVATIRLTKKRQLFMDLAVPRNIEPSIQYREDIQVFDMDQISFRLDEVDADKDKIVKKILADLSEEVADFKQWYQERKAVPYLQELALQTIEIKEDTLASLERKLPELTEHQLLLIDKHLQSVINQMKRKPIDSLKEFARKKSSNDPKDTKNELKSFARALGFSVEIENTEESPEVLAIESEEISIERN
ncbi:MAG: glutamyl-tRNA reductase [Carnobacterium sp.]|nr:glutamyl-tRNA reductase [Carnobacterium sp.]